MSRSPRDFTSEVSTLKEFLMVENWEQRKETSNLSFFSAPQSLGIKGPFTIALPTRPNVIGSDVVVNEAVKVLQDIYGFRFSELLGRIASKSEILGPAQFSVRFIGESTSDGGMPLRSLKGFAENLLKGLYHSAKLRLDGSSDGPANTSAEEMAGQARFMQTEFGSFVAKIEVPFLVLRQEDLFGNLEVTSHDVCSHLLSGLSFINERILQGESDFQSDSLITESINLFDPGLLDDYEKIVIAPHVDEIEVQMSVGSQRRRSSTGAITEDRIFRLHSFTEFFKLHFSSESEVEVVGSIVELRSRDPAGDRNHVRIMGNFHGDKVYFSASLNNEQYQVAVEAHRSKRLVRIHGEGIRLRTQIRISKVSEFSVLNYGDY